MSAPHAPKLTATMLMQSADCALCLVLAAELVRSGQAKNAADVAQALFPAALAAVPDDLKARLLQHHGAGLQSK